MRTDSLFDRMWADQRVLVTGAHGFIGRHVVRQVNALGADVICPYREKSRFDPDLPGTHVQVDLSVGDQARSVMDGADIVIHLAARTGGIQLQSNGMLDMFESNRLISCQVFSACAATGVRRLFVASSATVYEPSASPLAEGSPLISPSGDGSGYARSKVLEESAVRRLEGNTEVVVGRITNAFGPGGTFEESRATVVHDLIRKAFAAKPGGEVIVWGAASTIRSFIYVEDLAAAIRLVVERGVAGGTYNLDTGVAYSIGHLARQICDLVDSSIELRFSPMGPRGPGYRVLDVEKLANLGFSPQVSLEEGLRRTIEAYTFGGADHVATGF